ncbi:MULTISPECIES: hypothetical protein [Bacillus subtilis group]|uniref:hypothetical protein n=1 Tax=Bacillus subtilis group TaxID=653685 RepID=UPI0011A82410|nr:hypothetical protein [Bacillus velezensis]
MTTLFQTGTATKTELYGVMKNLLLQAGWINVSSNPATDYDVFKSTGETGDKELVFQTRPYYGTSTAGVNNIESTDFHYGGIRLIGGYTPSGTSGTSGTFDRTLTNEGWKNLPFACTVTTQSFDKNTPVTYRYSVNKNRLIFVTEYPPALNTPPCMFYIGIPDETYCSEPKSRGLLYLTSCQGVVTSSVYITDNAGEVASQLSSKSMGTLCQLAPKNPNSAGNFTLSEIFYGDSSEGVRGKLTGIFALPTQNIANGDIIVQGGQEYLVVVNGTSGNDMFPSKAIALPLAPPNA